MSLGVIFDISGSMSNKIDKSRDAVVEFFRTANPEDEFFLITFSEKPEVLSRLHDLGRGHSGASWCTRCRRAGQRCWTRFTWE